MSFGEFLSQILGWLGEFVSWVFAWLPRRIVISFTERAVHYPLGTKPKVIGPGTFWFIPNRGQVNIHFVTRFILEIEPLALETKDGIAISIGMTVTGAITDVYKYDVENLTPDANMIERAKFGLREIVMEHLWTELCKSTGEGTRLEGKLSTRMQKVLENFGLTVEHVGFTDQIRLGVGAHRLFGMFHNPDLTKA